MMGSMVLLEKAHRNAQRSERNPTDQGREREAAAAVGVDSRGEMDQAQVKTQLEVGVMVEIHRRRESSMVGSLEKVGCVGSEIRGSRTTVQAAGLGN